MVLKERFIKQRETFFSDNSINSYNINLFKKFFIWEEEKLKRQNGLSHLDESNYITLSGYINKLKNVNSWFKNKPWNSLTVKDIKKVYNDLEDGVIINSRGKRFADRRSYYNKVFKAKPFKMAGLGNKVEQAIEFFTDKQKKEVEFIDENTFKDMITVLSKPQHVALFWLAWDIGENINSLLRLKKSHFKRQINNETKEPEYLIFLPSAILKRSRQTRSEPTIYIETVRALDILFKMGKKVEYRDSKGMFRRKYEPFIDEDIVFRFGYRQALKLIDSVIKKVKAKCEPSGKKPSWKNLRSGMACRLHVNGWSVEDINLRLGHSPTSRWFDSYVNYLAVRKREVVKKHYNSNLHEIKEQLEESKQREVYLNRKLENQGKEFLRLKEDFEEIKEGKGFLSLLLKLSQKDKEKLALSLSNNKFDTIMSSKRR